MMRKTKATTSQPITPATYDRLLKLLEARYAGKWWRVVEVCPAAVVKTIDNESDALQTIANLEAKK